VGETANAVYGLPTAEEDRTHSVRLVMSCGMPAGIRRAFEQRYGLSVVEWFGTMAGAFACNPVGAGPVGSFGRPPVGWPALAVVDDDGHPAPAGTIGELVVRVRPGWSPTGHLARRDAEGWFYAADQWRDDGVPPPAVPEPETAVPKPARLSA
jgi:crotonobetaine/carnitine-CoA ligase